MVLAAVRRSRSGIAAYSAEILPVLQQSFEMDWYGEADAHDFVWKHQRQPYDLTVYHLGNARCHDYMWAYLVRYPGLLVLHDARLHHARARHLLAEKRADDYRREFQFDHPDAPPRGRRICGRGPERIDLLLLVDAAGTGHHGAPGRRSQSARGD